jgi:hypothetical protein
LAFSVGALHRIPLQATRPLQFNFLGNGRYRGAYLVDYFFQSISVYVEPLGPGAHLTGVCQINLIANWRVFDSSHCNFPWMRFNGVSPSSFRAFVQYAAPTAAPRRGEQVPIRVGQMAKYSLRADVVRSALQKRTSLGGSIFRGAYDPGDVPFAELEPLVQPVPKQLVPISIPAITGPASLEDGHSKHESHQ